MPAGRALSQPDDPAFNHAGGVFDAVPLDDPGQQRVLRLAFAAQRVDDGAQFAQAVELVSRRAIGRDLAGAGAEWCRRNLPVRSAYCAVLESASLDGLQCRKPGSPGNLRDR
mgnify:CR=1 FL=1